MSDQPTQRDRIRAVISEWRRHWFGTEPAWPGGDADLAARLDEALTPSVTGTGEGHALPPITPDEQTGPALVGPFLTSEELEQIQRHDLWTSAEQTALIRHLAALNATIANQNATMAAQQRSAQELEALQSEVPRALRLYPLGEVMGRGVMADRVPLIAELLRAAQAEREGRRG